MCFGYSRCQRFNRESPEIPGALARKAEQAVEHEQGTHEQGEPQLLGPSRVSLHPNMVRI